MECSTVKYGALDLKGSRVVAPVQFIAQLKAQQPTTAVCCLLVVFVVAVDDARPQRVCVLKKL